MNKQEALVAMKDGKKVTREYFGGDEYIYICKVNGIIRSEEDYDFRDWWDNIEPNIGKSSEDCWSIFEDDS